MAKGMTTEEVSAVIHTSIATSLKTVAKLRRDPDGSAAVEDCIANIEGFIVKAKSLLTKLEAK